MPRRPSAPLERDIQRTCLDWLRLVARAFVIRTNSGGVVVPAADGRRSRFVRMNSQPGCSDALAVLPGGRFLACEFKRPGGKPTDAQRSFLDAVRAAGGIAVVATCVEDIQTALRAEGYEV